MDKNKKVGTPEDIEIQRYYRIKNEHTKEIRAAERYIRDQGKAMMERGEYITVKEV